MNAGEPMGPYVIEAAIGEGGMGAVYRARDTRLDRTVALKVSKADFSDRFEREAKAVAALNHPNICTLFDVGPNYLVMEDIAGTPLKRPPAVEKAVEYRGQILDALDALRQTDETMTQALTGQGQIVGTLQYMASEQLQGKKADARSDLFAFGCVALRQTRLRRLVIGERHRGDPGV